MILIMMRYRYIEETLECNFVMQKLLNKKTCLKENPINSKSEGTRTSLGRKGKNGHCYSPSSRRPLNEFCQSIILDLPVT